MPRASSAIHNRYSRPLSTRNSSLWGTGRKVNLDTNTNEIKCRYNIFVYSKFFNTHRPLFSGLGFVHLEKRTCSPSPPITSSVDRSSPDKEALLQGHRADTHMHSHTHAQAHTSIQRPFFACPDIHPLMPTPTLPKHS